MRLILAILILLITLNIKAQSFKEAHAFLDRSEYTQAIKLFKTLKAKALKEHSIPNVVLANNGIAAAYNDLGAHYKAITTLKKNIQLLDSTHSNQLELYAETHVLLATNYRSLMLLEDYKLHAELFYSYYQKKYPNKAIFKALYYAYIGDYYKIKFAQKKAEYYIENALIIFRKNKKDAHLIDAYKIYQINSFVIRDSSKGTSREQQLKYGDSLLYYFKQRYPGEHVKKSAILVAKTAINLDNASHYLYITKGDNPELGGHYAMLAIQDYNKAIAINDSKTSFCNPSTARIEALKGLMYFYLKDYTNAISSYNKGIERLTTLHENSSGFSLNNHNLMGLLRWKSWCLGVMYSETGDIELLYEENTNLLLMELVWERYFNEIINSKTQFYTDTYSLVPYAFLMKNYIELYELTNKDSYLEKVLEYNEKSKYASLLNAISSNKTPKQNTEPLNQKKLEAYNALCQVLLSKSGLALENETNSKTKIDTYLKELIKADPHQTTPIITLQEIQNNLKSNEALISLNSVYFQANVIPYMMLIEKNKIKLIRPKTVKQLAPGVVVSDSIHRALETNNIKLFKREARQIYSEYFKPIEDELSEHITHLKIIPDAQFSHVPFETLLYKDVETNDFRKLPYLIAKYDFSYALSASISKLNNTKNEETRHHMAVFSPSFDGDALSQLKLSSLKAKELSEIYDATFFRGDMAKLKNFEKAIENTKIVTIFSHGQSFNNFEDEKKGIYFADAFLNMNDIYNLKSSCDFLILSACETGYGPKEKGEGNINLARALSSIGVKSMLLASWKIDEASTLAITTRFLDYLQQGFSKSKALQKAKLDFIKTANPRNANPYYWSGLNIVGNNDAITPNPDGYAYHYGWILLVFPFAGGFWYYKKRKKT